MSSSESERLLAIVVLDDGEYESVRVLPVVDDLYMVEEIPVAAYGVSWHDLVVARPDGSGALWSEGVVRKSGHRTLRLALGDRIADPGARTRVLDELERLGCAARCNLFSRRVLVDVPPAVDAAAVAAYLASTGCPWEFGDPPEGLAGPGADAGGPAAPEA
jgi:hypothetical protein